eukprot:Nk52_evm30s2133 gene=Nk52_evmTU30s2133
MSSESTRNENYPDDPSVKENVKDHTCQDDNCELEFDEDRFCSICGKAFCVVCAKYGKANRPTMYTAYLRHTNQETLIVCMQNSIMQKSLSGDKGKSILKQRLSSVLKGILILNGKEESEKKKSDTKPRKRKATGTTRNNASDDQNAYGDIVKENITYEERIAFEYSEDMSTMHQNCCKPSRKTYYVFRESTPISDSAESAMRRCLRKIKIVDLNPHLQAVSKKRYTILKKHIWGYEEGDNMMSTSASFSTVLLL